MRPTLLIFVGAAAVAIWAGGKRAQHAVMVTFNEGISYTINPDLSSDELTRRSRERAFYGAIMYVAIGCMIAAGVLDSVLM